MDEKMVSSDVFPKIKIDADIKVAVDNVLKKIKDSPDSDVKAFAQELSSKAYNIKNGSPEDQAMCIGSNNSFSGTIYVPVKLVGTYMGSDGKRHSATTERMLSHELAHALEYDRKESGMTKSIMPRIIELAMQDNAFIKAAGTAMTPAQIAGSHNKFSPGIAHEAGAVAVENFIAKQVFHDFNARANVHDKNPEFSIEDLKAWYKEKYPMTGTCRGVPLAREVETSPANEKENAIKTPDSKAAQSAANQALKNHPELMADYLNAKHNFMSQLIDRPALSQEIMITQFNLHAASQIVKGISPLTTNTEKQSTLEA